jgi:uncharacterized protein YgbK (DUF1537 family)
MSPEAMERELRPMFEELRNSGARLVHYKTCSTFDSSAEIGSIGRVLELARELFDNAPVPMVIGAPNLGRYQVFGTLFARSGLDSETYRLDRHPTMSVHPITPMREADLRRVLAEQTTLPIGLVDVLAIAQATPTEIADWLRNTDAAAYLLDCLDESHMANIGKAILTLAEESPVQFLIGSSGVEYALTSAWSETLAVETRRATSNGTPEFSAVDQLLVVTGSCSPVTERQTAWAEQHGFETIAINTPKLASEVDAAGEIEWVVAETLKKLNDSKSVIVHTSRGPADARVAQTRNAFQEQGLSELEVKLESGRVIGTRLGTIVGEIFRAHPLRRVAIAGGDTSSYTARSLGITALEAIAPVAPGSPLCRAHAENTWDGVELLFKGGQVGHDDVWGTVLYGTQSRNSLRESER